MKYIGGRVVAILALAAALVLPQGSRALTLVPPSLEFSVQPGGQLKTEVKLFNESNTQTILYPSTANFTAGDQNGTPSFDPQGKQTDLASWIKVDQASYTLAAAEKLTIPVTINVPANADPGGHYAALFFGTTAPKAANGGSVGISSKIGALIILRVEGQINESAKLTTWTVKGSKTTLTRPPVTFEAVIQNAGNVHVRPQGTVVIRNMIGGQTDTEVFNPNQGAILPNSSRIFDVSWDKTSGNEKSGFFGSVAAEWHNFALGTYTATLNLNYGSSQQTLIGSTRVTIFPWQLLLVVLLLIILVIVLLTLGIRQYNAMIIKRAERGMPKR